MVLSSNNSLTFLGEIQIICFDSLYAIIIFSKKYLDDVKYPENVNLIEKSKLRLNPIKAIINTEFSIVLFEKI